jgi:flavin reductase (DIM6/NTAB) family NADH-FMN oxidoreductase RutF
MAPGALADGAFTRLAAHSDEEMVIVTARAGQAVDGCLVGFATQCSIDPVHYLVCLSKVNRTYELARRSSALAVHVLHDTDEDRRLASLFGEHTEQDPDESDKLGQCLWTAGPWGLPILDGHDWFAGEIVYRYDVGDHEAFVLAVGPGGTPVPEGPPGHSVPRLGFQAVRALEAGNPP